MTKNAKLHKQFMTTSPALFPKDAWTKSWKASFLALGPPLNLATICESALHFAADLSRKLLYNWGFIVDVNAPGVSDGVAQRRLQTGGPSEKEADLFAPRLHRRSNTHKNVTHKLRECLF
jgi:hypothetical protein